MSSSKQIEQQVSLARNRWTVSLLADLAAHNGARFVELLHRLDIARDSLVRTIEAAVVQGWVERNPGHGHPLRPEYILTAQGKEMAMVAGRVQEAGDVAGVERGGLSRWSMPIICSIGIGNRRFNDLSRTLAPASPRALSQGLRKLADQRLVVRELVESYPPTSLYDLTDKGLLLARAA